MNPWNTVLLAEPASSLSSRIAPLRHAEDLPSNRGSSLDLPERGGSDATELRSSGLPSMGAVVASLCFVLGLFFFLAWLVRRAVPRAARALPTDVAEPLGRISLAPRHDAQLLRVGNKLLLVSLSPAGAEPLVEITDPVEVDRLIGICKQDQPDSSTTTFKQVFQQFAAQKVSGGLLGRRGQSNHELANLKPIPSSESHA